MYRETFTSKRPENYCETVKIIKGVTKIGILFINNNFLKIYAAFFKNNKTAIGLPYTQQHKNV